MCAALSLRFRRAVLLATAHHHHVTNQAIASMPSTPRPTGAEGRATAVGVWLSLAATLWPRLLVSSSVTGHRPVRVLCGCACTKAEGEQVA
jgi:hypothetical protein